MVRAVFDKKAAARERIPEVWEKRPLAERQTTGHETSQHCKWQLYHERTLPAAQANPRSISQDADGERESEQAEGGKGADNPPDNQPDQLRAPEPPERNHPGHGVLLDRTAQLVEVRADQNSQREGTEYGQEQPWSEAAPAHRESHRDENSWRQGDANLAHEIGPAGQQ